MKTQAQEKKEEEKKGYFSITLSDERGREIKHTAFTLTQSEYEDIRKFATKRWAKKEKVNPRDAK